MLLDLQNKYPEKYTNGQLRTLQRRVKVWRRMAIIMYDDNLLKDNPLVENTNIGDLKAVTVGIPDIFKKTSLAI